MEVGHRGRSVTNCPECWEFAYEPGWYAVMRASDIVIHLPADPDGTATVQLPESGQDRSTDLSTHTPVTGWRGRR